MTTIFVRGDNRNRSTTMDWMPLDSSVFDSVAYVPLERMLYLRFRKSGDAYRYFDFSPEQYRDFVAADSKGRYFSTHIRDIHGCERLAPRSLTANEASI